MVVVTAIGGAVRRWWPALLVGALAACTVVVATRGGVDHPPDGTTYAGVARNIAEGEGVTSPFVAVIDPFGPQQAVDFEGRVPLLGWPPMYPLVMAPGVAAGMEPADSARWLSALAAAVTAGLVVAGVRTLASPRRFTAPSGTAAGSAAAAATPEAKGGDQTSKAVWVVAAVAAAVVVVQPWFALVHVVVASEPLYLASSLLALVLGALALAPRPAPRPPVSWAMRDESVLLAAFLVAAFSVGVRYIGVATVLALAVGTVLFGPGQLLRRSRLAVAGAAAGIVPLVWWSRHVDREAGVPLRRIAWHPPGRADLELAVSEVTAWMVPREDPTLLRSAAVALVAGTALLAVIGWRTALRGSDGPAPAVARPWLVLMALSTMAHLVVVLATRTLADRVVPMNGRLMLPVLAPLVISGAAGLVWWWRLARPAPLREVGRGAALACVAALCVMVGAFLADQSEGWRPAISGEGSDAVDSETSRAIRELDARLLAANDPALTWRITGAQVIVVPNVYDNASGEVNDQLDEHLDELVEVLEERDGVVVLHRDAGFANPGLVGVEELTTDAGLVVVAELDGATVLSPGKP